MSWLYLVSYFFGGVFLANAVPHFVNGMMGRSFQSPFAKPPGKGLSSSTVNVLWGFFNAVVGYLLGTILPHLVGARHGAISRRGGRRNRFRPVAARSLKAGTMPRGRKNTMRMIPTP